MYDLDKLMTTGYASEAIDGTILSDANLHIHKRGVNAVYLIALSGREHLDWLYFIKDMLEILGVAVTPGHPRVRVRIGPTGKPYDYCCLQTRSSSALTPQFHRYKGGRKEVPRDLVLTPILLANWFMGDGTSPRFRKYPNYITASFATHGFPASSVEFLVELMGGIGLHTTNERVGLRLRQGSVGEFMELVGPHILPSYRYKIRYSRR